MKKIIAILLALTFALSLAACGGSEEPVASDDPTSAEQPSAPAGSGDATSEPTVGSDAAESVETSVPNESEESQVSEPVSDEPEPSEPSEPAASEAPSDEPEPSSEPTEPSAPEESSAPAETSKPTESSEPSTPPHTHSYTSKVTKNATCTADGVKTFTCSCGDSYTEKIKATGHTWGEWKTVKEPTTSAEGTSQRTCKTCGATENKSIAKLPPEEKPQNQHFYNDSLDGRWVVDSITVVPKEVYFENGKLVAHCYIVNGYSTTATNVGITQIIVADKNGVQFANAYFYSQNLTIAPLSYVEHTFTFGADTLSTTNVDMSYLYVDAWFEARH